MPKRKHRHHKSHRRHRRHMGAMGLKGKDSTMKLAALAGGFLLGKQINGAIDNLLTKVMPAPTTTTTTTTSSTGTIATVGEIGLGGLLLLRKRSATPLKLIGGLLAGAGIRRAIGAMGIMNGYQSVPVIGRHRMAGYQSVPVIGRGTIPAQLAGGSGPAQLQGFRVNGYTPTGSGVMGSIGAVDGGSGITNSGGGGYMG